MTIEEKRAWIIAVAVDARYAVYVVIVLGRAGGRPLADVSYARALLWTVGAAIVAAIVLSIAVTIGRPEGGELKDERDREIGRFGDHVGQSFVVIGAVAALLHGDGRVRPLLDRQRDLPGASCSRRCSARSPRSSPTAGFPAVVKPTRVTNRIRALRFAHGEMTQAELADRIGVTRQTVIAIEQGRYSPSLEMAFQIARVFGVPLDDVFQYPEPRRHR